MSEVGSYRKRWNEQQKELRRELSNSGQLDRAVELFLRQHAMLHSQEVAKTAAWSFEDTVFEDISEAMVRRIPRNREHSVAWCIWHAARIEDVTMNLLVAGSEQLFVRDGWHKRLKITVRDTGNGMDATTVAELSNVIDIEALRTYRVAIGRRTQAIVQELQPGQQHEKVAASRLERVMAEGAVAESEQGLIDYWGKRTVAGLLLMPPTRHNMVHLNEAWQLKQRRQ